MTDRRVYQTTIESIVERAPDTRSFFLRLPDSVVFRFVPGQFLSCLLPIGGQEMIRPYSLASSPEEARLEICLNLVPGGPGSTYLFGLEPGASVRFTGPWGTFTLEQPPAAECVFIADGAGIAPIRPMLRRALATAGTTPIRLYHAAPSPQHLLYRDEFESAARTQPRFSFSPLDSGSLVARIVECYVSADADRSRHFYICGVGDIVPRLRDLLRQAGYERRAVQYEKW
jgi:CDP-4-dehydro-6-deoxyglucose reductase